jgi:FixJ family two-component response regulator
MADEFIEKATRKHPLSLFHANWLYDMADAAVARYRAAQARQARAKNKVTRALAKLTPTEQKLLGVHVKGRKR